MESDSRKKSRRDKMMHSKSFETQKVREIGQKKAEESRSFFIFWIGIIEDVFKMEGKECKVQERWKKKIHARARKVLLHEIGNFVWASGSGGREVGGSRKKFGGGERKAKGQVRPPTWHVACGARKDSLWLCYAGPWLRNKKVRSQVIDID